MPRKPKAIRRENDFYITPPWMVYHLLDRLDICLPTGRVFPSYRPIVLEPCVGQGHIVRTIASRYPKAKFLTNDIDPVHKSIFVADSYLDATKPEFWNEVGDFDWMITNPPFSDAFPIIWQAVARARIGVAVLLRRTWDEPTDDRGLWLSKNPPAWELVMERYAFRGSGADSATAAWFVWSKYLTPRIEIIPGRHPQPALLGEEDWKTYRTISPSGIAPSIRTLRSPILA